jgi:hypothetical protein
MFTAYCIVEIRLFLALCLQIIRIPYLHGVNIEELAVENHLLGRAALHGGDPLEEGLLAEELLEER